MPAGSNTKALDPPVQDEENEDLEPVLEVPAVGEAVTYVTIEPQTGRHEEHAAQITWLETDGNVDLAVFMRHSRGARPMQNVPYYIEAAEVPSDERHYWRYPQPPAVPEEDEDE